MCFLAYKCEYHIIILILLSTYKIVRCDAISNTSLSASLRDYSANDTSNVKNVKTLQNKESGKMLHILPPNNNPIKFKDAPDRQLSSSSNSRGLLIHEHPGYNDYEEGPHYDYGHNYHYYEHHPDLHDPHNYDHYGYEPHYYVGHHKYHKGHYKYSKHALATKAALWPLAGIALLSAAAALVTNPVLLQLGVVSGKRRRRDTEEITGPDFPLDAYKHYTEKNNPLVGTDTVKTVKQVSENVKRTFLKTNNNKIENLMKKHKIKVLRTKIPNSTDQVTGKQESWAKPIADNDEDEYIPIPIKLRSPKMSRT